LTLMRCGFIIIFSMKILAMHKILAIQEF